MITRNLKIDNPLTVVSIFASIVEVSGTINNNTTIAGYAGHVDLLTNGIPFGELNLYPDGGINRIDVWVLQ